MTFLFGYNLKTVIQLGESALKIRASQRSITASLGPLTAEIYPVMIIVTGSFSKRYFYFYYYHYYYYHYYLFLEVVFNDLKLFSWNLNTF